MRLPGEQTTFRYAQAIAPHLSWLSAMPWSGIDNLDPAVMETVMDNWINEYSGEFCPADVSLVEVIDWETCGTRMLKLLSGPCADYAEEKNSTGVTFRKVAAVLNRQTGLRPSVADGICAVRDVYRGYGKSDGIRHCILANALEAGCDAAIRLFPREFDSVRLSLIQKFGAQIGESAVDDVWQEVLTDMIVGVA